MFEECCEISIDCRSRVMDCEPGDLGECRLIAATCRLMAHPSAPNAKRQCSAGAECDDAHAEQRHARTNDIPTIRLNALD
jgi:hypothetical protein